jgi:hypothetical protein
VNSGNLHISNHCNDLNDGKEKFRFTITFDTKHVDTDDNNKKHRDKNGMVVFLLLVPIVDRNGSSDDLQGENH